MAIVIKTKECFPKAIEFFGFTLPAPDIDHEHCPKGQTASGILGGWLCPCFCHER